MSCIKEDKKNRNQYLMELWSEKFVSEVSCSFDSCGNIVNPKLGPKGSKLVFHVPMVIEKWKSILEGNLKWIIRFRNHYLKIVKFWLLVAMSSTQRWVKKVQICISYVTLDKLMKSKRYCETVRRIIHLWTLSLKILEVLFQLGDVINPKLAWKRARTGILCTSDDTNLWMHLLLQSFPLNINSS